jgi:hypothetical protein
MMQVSVGYVHQHLCWPTMNKVKPTFKSRWLMLDFPVVLSGSKLYPLALLYVGFKFRGPTRDFEPFQAVKVMVRPANKAGHCEIVQYVDYHQKRRTSEPASEPPLE